MVNSTRAAIVALALAAVAGVSFLSAGAEPVEARQAAPPPVRLAIINSGVILNDAPGRAAAQAVLTIAIVCRATKGVVALRALAVVPCAVIDAAEVYRP